MRIAMILSTPLPPREGIGYYVWNLTKCLMKQGHQVQLITRGSYHRTGCEIIEGIPIWRPPFIPVYPYHVHLHGLFVAGLIRKLEKVIDLFHLHSPLVPVISSERPALLTFHSTVPLDTKLTPVVDFYTLLMKLQAPFSYQLELNAMKKAFRVNAVSAWAARDLQNYPHHPAKINVMWNGVDNHFFSPHNQDIADPRELLFVGRLAAGKGLHELIPVFKLVVSQIPDARLSIVGDGPLFGMLQSLIEQNGLKDHVRLTGHVSSREDLRAMYSHAWGLILPSHHESLPGVILEAMACGTPVIATRVGGIPDVIEDMVNGILVNSRDIDAMAEAVCQLMRDANLHSKLGKAGRETIENRFTWQQVGENYLKCYNDILVDTH